MYIPSISSISSIPSCDSGLDIYTPQTHEIKGRSYGNMVPLGIKCSTTYAGGYLLLPRSSLGKTPIRLSNSVGLIDNSYRGEICALVDNISDNTFIMEKFSRHFQLVSSDLKSIEFKIVDSLSFLDTTERGEGGFGSTGK